MMKFQDKVDTVIGYVSSIVLLIIITLLITSVV
jgi:hypothetical protein